MPAPPSLPLLKRVPPGVWTAVTWYAALIQPIVEFVWLRPANDYSYAYPHDGLASYGARLLLVLAAALALGGCVLLRRRPAPAFLLLLGATVVSTLGWRQTEIPPTQYLAVVVAVGFLTAVRPRRTSLAVAGAALGVLAGYLVARLLLVGDYSGTPSEPYVALTVVIAWLIGNSVRQAREYARRLTEQAAAQAVTAERLRIAREMHDSVAHSIGIIALQAGAAARVVDTQPDGARAAMIAVETAGRDTLAGLRRMLGALRQGEPERMERAAQAPTGPASGPTRGPAPGLADVERLAAETSAAGVRVEVRLLGERRPLPAEIDLAAYRIIQESVTNVVRHATARSCRVSVDYRDEEEVALEITDSGSAEPPEPLSGTGYGIAGMRERVALLHGEFTAGARPGGGFRVAARLPVPQRAALR